MQDVANQVKILVLFMLWMLTRGLVRGGFFSLEGYFRAAGRANFDC